jgi:DNA-binding response OmpR family regulator
LQSFQYKTHKPDETNFSAMTAVSLTQPEIIDRLRVNFAIWDRIADKKANLRAEEQRIEYARAELRAAEQRLADTKAELSTEEGALLAKEAKLRTWLHELNENGAITPVPLDFDPDGKTIRWAGGQVKLGSLPCKFVKTLYFADGQQMAMTDVEGRVWGEAEDATIQQTASSLRRTLAENDFPYSVVNVLNKQWQEPEFSEAKGNRHAPIRLAIASFALVLT